MFAGRELYGKALTHIFAGWDLYRVPLAYQLLGENIGSIIPVDDPDRHLPDP